MRYEATESIPLDDMVRYPDSDGLHFMLNFTVSLARVSGVVLWFLGRRGRVLWLQVWSVGLVLASVAYLGAAVAGLTRGSALGL